MTFTLGEIYSLTRSLNKLTNKELPIKVSFRLFKFLKDSSVAMESLEKTRIKLVEKFAEEAKEGEEMKVADSNREKFQEEFSVLLQEETEVEFDPISIDDLGDITISTNDLIPMQKLFIEK